MTTALAPLWAIEEELLALLDSVETCPQELQPELQAQIAAYMAQSAEKVDHIAHVLAALDYEQKSAADEIARLTERKKAAKAAQDRLEAYVCRVIAARGVKALKGDTNTLSVRPSEAVKITDEATVPDLFRHVTITITAEAYERIWPILPSYDAVPTSKVVAVDKAAITKALKLGEVPGCDLETRSNLQRK